MSKPPSIAALDYAIETIEFYRIYRSCCAIYDGVRQVESNPRSTSNSFPLTQARLQLYGSQYERFARSKTPNGFRPWWWDTFTYDTIKREQAAKNGRLKMLRAFRKACIDAAKKGK